MARDEPTGVDQALADRYDGADRLAGRDAALRAELLAALLAGIGVLRSETGTGALGAASVDQLVVYVDRMAGVLLADPDGPSATPTRRPGGPSSRPE